MGHGEPIVALQGSPVFEGLLAQCRSLACARLDQAVADMLEKADAALEDLGGRSMDREAKKLYAEARDVVRMQRAEIQQQFHAIYLAEFKQRSKKGNRSGIAFDAVRSSFELVLVGDDDLDETLRFNAMAARLRRYCDEELNALDQRVGVLLGDADLQSEDSPLSPQAICDAYKKTCRKLVGRVALRGVFLRLFDDHVLDEIRPVYKALNDLLVQNAILPRIRYGVTKKAAGKAPKGGKGKAEQDNSRAGADGESAGETDVFAALQKLFAGKGGASAGAGAGSPVGGAWGPGGGAFAPGGGGAFAAGGGSTGQAMGVGGVPMLQGAELLVSLTKLQLESLAAFAASGAQHAAAGARLAANGGQFAAGAPVTGTTNVLHALKSSAVGASMGQMDAMTLDVVAMLFDQLFDDPKIPLGAKGLIGRMQIPMLKVAIADKELFSRKTHPARRLLDTLGEIAMRLPADFNTGSPLFGHLETILQGLVGGYEDDIEIFDIVRGQLIALMDREDARIEKEAQAAAERVMQEELLAVAKVAAQEEVQARVQNQPLPGAVLEFLVEQWLKLMMVIHARRGTQSEAWQHALEAMDQLIWSVQPRDSAEDRRRLAALVPPLLKRLAAGLEVAGIGHEVRDQFFEELLKAHAQIMGAPLKAKAEAPQAGHAQHGQHVAQDAAAAPTALDFTVNITVRNPFGGGDVQVSAADLAAPATDLDGLERGDWLEFRDAETEQRRPARLIFISPRKTRYIFSDRGEKDYIECTRSELSRRLRTGEAVVMDDEPEVPFFERILGGVIGKLRGAPAPA